MNEQAPAYGRRLVESLPLLVAAVLYAFVTESVVVAAMVVTAALLALVTAPLIHAPRFAERATLLLVVLFGALGGAATLTALEPDVRARPPVLLGRVAVAALLLAAARRFFRDAEGGMRVDFALVTIAVVVSGQRHVGTPYVVAVVLFVVAIVLVVRSKDSGVGLSVVEANAPLPTAGILVAVALLSTLGMLAIPRLARLTERQFERYVLPTGRSQVGFTDRLATGSPDPLVESDEVVLRIYGPHVDYLRGRVYDTYDRGSWNTGAIPLPRVIATASGRPPGFAVTEIRGVGVMQRAAWASRFFVPLGARHFATAHGFARVDVFGVLHAVEDGASDAIAFEAGLSEYEAAPPTELDRAVPDALSLTLEPIAREWTRGATSAEARLAAIEQHLAHDFSYTLDGIPVAREPVVTFLTTRRRGRCELFASALALLGRTLGVPTRVVGGFRVAEHNAVGGYDVVREKNAHAWVEAWVGEDVGAGEGRWRTFDGTPVTETNMRKERRGLAAVVDALLALWDRALELLSRAALWQFGVLLGGAVALLTLVRVVRARRERRLAARTDGPQDGPLPWFSRLEAALGSRGLARSPSEPLEWYAERLRSAQHESAATVVLEYSALRYGGVGDPDAVAVRALECAREIEATRRAP